MTARSPAATALIDQTQAATDHAHGVLQRLADHAGTPVSHRVPGPVGRALLHRMQATMLAQAQAHVPTLCAHLDYRRPAPTFWLAYAPGKLRCPVCAQTAGRRVRGTVEDRRCDHCHRIEPRLIYPVATIVPAMVIDIDEIPLAGLPPITVMFGLCKACKTLDEAGEP